MNQFHKHNKYRNKRTQVDGIYFASKKEAEHYLVLKDREKKGEIYALELQPRYKLFGKNGGFICTYVADFEYIERLAPVVRRKATVDVKGMKTAMYKLKAKLFADNYGREVLEV